MNPYSQLTERQIAILRALQDAHARGPSSSVSAHSLHLADDDDVDALVALRVVRRDDSDPAKLYAPLSRSAFGASGRASKPFLGIYLAIALMFAMLAWAAFFQRPH